MQVYCDALSVESSNIFFNNKIIFKCINFNSLKMSYLTFSQTKAHYLYLQKKSSTHSFKTRAFFKKRYFTHNPIHNLNTFNKGQ